MATTWEAVPENIKRRLTTDLAKLASRIKRKQHHKRISWKQKLLFHAMRQMQKARDGGRRAGLSILEGTGLAWTQSSMDG